MIITTALIWAAAAAAYAENTPVDIRVNGEYIKTYAEPIIMEGVTYAPVRGVADALCADRVEWDDEKKEALIECGGSEVVISTVGGKVKKDDVTVSSKSEAFISESRTYIPVRLISELFGAEVGWDELYRNVEISSDFEVPAESIDYAFTHDDVYWLSRIINAESGGEIYEGQIAVGDVILNRVDSDEFPDTIYGVIFDKKYSVQFEPVANGTIYNEPTVLSAAAAKVSLTNESSVGKCLYFFNPSIASSSWISKNREYYKTIGGHDFYL